MSQFIYATVTQPTVFKYYDIRRITLS